MNKSATFIVSTLGMAGFLITCSCPIADAQQSLLEFQHGGVYLGAPPAAPAMSLRDVRPQVAELSGLAPKLNHVGSNGNIVHIHHTAQVAAARSAAGLAGTPPLLYHSGGSVMNPWIAVYLIFWVPSKLQNGSATGYSANYGTPTILTGAWLAYHGIQNIATQYYQTINGTTTYVSNSGGLGGYYVDTAAYPPSGCTDTVTPGNCITDAQIQAEITRVMGVNGWTGGMNKVFVVLTSSGEGSCIDSTNASCAYSGYCGYHSAYSLGGQNVIYANIPFGTTACQGQGQTTPNDLNGDIAANTMSHEIIEAATDPLGDAWFDSSGNEMADLCAYSFGTNTWGSNAGAGNQMWNGLIFELQQEYDNHAAACVQVGPQ
jgi:hypothetical protein